MKRCSSNRVQVIIVCAALLALTGCGSSLQSCGNTGNCDDTELLSVVAISRHGIRSPTLSQDTMNLYTQRPQGFPAWSVPADVPGDLSTEGQDNAARLGVWYRDYYATQGLLPPKGSCPPEGAVFVYADLNERTFYTAQGYLDGMFQSEANSDCGFKVIQSTEKVDPYIDTAAAGVCKIDTKQDLAAFAKLAGDPISLINTYSPQLQALQSVSECCQLAACATPEKPTPTSCTLLDLPTTVTTEGAVSFANGSLFDVADNLTETFELQYAQGMSDPDCDQTLGAQCVGWGVIPAGGVSDMSKLHVLNMVNLTCQLPSYAQVGSSNLMWQLVGAMDQTLTGVTNQDMLAPAESKFTLFVAHDENVATIAEFLGGATWNADGFQPNDPGPAGALVFELHKVTQSGQVIVRLFYVIASLDQMRSGTTLTLQTPPQRIPMSIPACGGQLDCPYSQFKSFITAHVRPDCIVPGPPKVTN